MDIIDKMHQHTGPTHGRTQWCKLHSWKHNVVTPRNEVPFWRSFIFYLLVRSKGRLVGRIYGFSMYCKRYLFNVYFGKLVMTFIDIGEIGFMSISKCHWMVIVVNLVKQTWLLAELPVGVVLCMPGQYRVFQPLAWMITARHRDMLNTRHCRCSMGISAHLFSRVWCSLPRFWVGLSITVITWPNSS